MNMHVKRTKKGKALLFFVITGIALLSFWGWNNAEYFQDGVIRLDQEHMLDGVPLNPSTQSINRYFSTLRELKQVVIDLDADARKVSFTIADEQGNHSLYINDIDVHYVVPLLPYPHAAEPDEFDRANLMLAEYARNGVSLSFQEHNNSFGIFNASDDLFSGEEESVYQDGIVQPNRQVRPKRLNVTNNCLKPGLWEFSGSDSVGEMYHGWFDFPKDTYYQIIRLANDLEISDWQLGSALRYKKDIKDVEVDLDRLRVAGRILQEKPAVINPAKQIGSYSTQDSRRKARKGYFKIVRDGTVESPATFGELRHGDYFEMHKFVAPGVYSPNDAEMIAYDPDWTRSVIREAKPLTEYPGGSVNQENLGHIEITLMKENGKDAIVMGNVPIDYLVFQEDYKIPAFGVGVLSSSELMERRFLRITQGPKPHFAYQVRKQDGKWMLVNNHNTGYEQIYLRPFERDGQMYLRLTLVSYERITDLLEVEIKISEDLAQQIRQASERYQRPLFRVYEDANLV